MKLQTSQKLCVCLVCLWNCDFLRNRPNQLKSRSKVSYDTSPDPVLEALSFLNDLCRQVAPLWCDRVAAAREDSLRLIGHCWDGEQVASHPR
jgi:hypothetical protein